VEFVSSSLLIRVELHRSGLNKFLHANVNLPTTSFNMKTLTSKLPALLLLSTLFLLNGCVAIGNRDAQRPNATLGQQLIDLQKARDSGALSETEYQVQKTHLLHPK